MSTAAARCFPKGASALIVLLSLAAAAQEHQLWLCGKWLKDEPLGKDCRPSEFTSPTAAAARRRDSAPQRSDGLAIRRTDQLSSSADVVRILETELARTHKQLDVVKSRLDHEPGAHETRLRLERDVLAIGRELARAQRTQAAVEAQVQNDRDAIRPADRSFVNPPMAPR